MSNNRKVIKKEITSFTKEMDDKEHIALLEELYQSHKLAGIPQAEDSYYEQSDLGTPTYKKVGFTKQEAVQIFLEHRYLGRKLIAEKYGVNRLFPGDPKKHRNIIERIYADIKKKPEEYAEFITPKEIQLVQDIVSTRVINNTVNLKDDGAMYGVVKSVKHIVSTPVRDMAVKLNDISSKSANILELVLNQYKTKKDIKDLDMKKVADTFKITFEAERLAKGESTQNIATYIKSEGLDKMDSDELIDVLNTQRQEN